MGSASVKTFDFIVVGAGPAGCMAATRLARTAKHPSVLLIEAGGKNDDESARIDAERWLTRMIPSHHWGYETIPQKHLDGMVLEYDRGKGLGGSSAINYSVWTVGPSSDYDEIARIVDDDEWKWSNAQPRYKRIESYFARPSDIPEGTQKYLSPNMDNHGLTGPIKIGYPTVWEKSFRNTMDSVLESGLPLNLDHNSGDPIGIAVCANSAYKGRRTTSADALVDAPANLTILIETQVARVTFDGVRATGIETIDGQQIEASSEVLLCSGALDTPRILMHSGIGPKDQLDEYGIALLQANSNVGENLLDHQHITMDIGRAEHTTDRHIYYKDKALQAAARAQWEKDNSGPLAEIATTMAIGFLKNEQIPHSAEFQALPEATQKHLLHPTTPHWEVIFNGGSPGYFIDPENTPALESVYAFIMNEQSRGSAKLQSSDPRTPLIYDANFQDHPYDRRIAIELTRQLLRLLDHPAYKKNTTGFIRGPKSDSEEDILAYWKHDTGSTRHMMGTAVMGKGVEDAVVDKNFKVFGVEGLRVADMSIYPIIPNNHIQSNAYLVGLMAGDKLVKEYELEKA